MKGITFQKPLEFSLRIDGESWKQGDPIQGMLEVRNHSGEPVVLEAVAAHLAYGDLKKVRQKSPDAFDILQTSRMESKALPGGQSSSFEWKFETDRNIPITDSTKSLFLLFGQGEATEKLGQLQLTFIPHQVIHDFLDRFTTTYRFVQKGAKAVKAGTDIKLAPPDGKAFSSLEYISLLLRFDDEALDLEYRFNTTRVEPTVAASVVVKEKKLYEQRLEKADYLIPSGRFNHERVEALIREALEQVESKIVF